MASVTQKAFADPNDAALIDIAELMRQRDQQHLLDPVGFEQNSFADSIAAGPLREMRSYKPSWRDSAGDFAYDLGRNLGYPGTGQTWREAVRGGVDFIPGVGDMVGAQEAARDFGAGNYGAAALGAGATAMGLVPGAGDLAAGGVRKVAGAIKGLPAGNNLGRISTRLPTARNSTEDPYTEALTIESADVLRSTSGEHNANLLPSYPGYGSLAGQDPEKITAGYINQSADNLKFIHDSINPDIRARSAKWYEGANNITVSLAEKYGVSEASVAGAMAALSPQKDWFQNASLAERTIDFMQENGIKPMSSDMVSWFLDSDKAAKFRDNPIMREIFEQSRNVPFNEIQTIEGKALAVRIFDEAHNPRGYRIITPEGEYADFAKTGKGERQKVAWGSLNEIGKAVASVESFGDPDVLSMLMGTKHKVRNFYNNILDPFGTMGDVTADTHAIAANQLRPLSGNTAAVAHNFGLGLPPKLQREGWVPPKSSAITGSSGTYGINADVYRKAAGERGILPRELQSITWEGVRGLFPDTAKRGSLPVEVDNIWKQVDLGLIGADDARAQITKLSGGFRDPDWSKSGSSAINPRTGSTYR